MAGNDSKKALRLAGRVGPSVDANKNSRVSKAAGSIGSESMRVEQRANTTKQRANNPVPARQSKGKKQGTKNGSPVNRPAPKASTPAPADSRFISRMHRFWSNLEPHHQQRIFGLVLIGLSILLICSLTIWRTMPLFKPLSGFFLTFFGWSAYPLAFGLFIFACAHFVEGVRNTHFIRMSLVLGLLILLLLLLAETPLIAHGTTGVIGSLLVYPLHGWPGMVGHVLIIGLFIIIA